MPSTPDSLLDFHTDAARHREARRPEPPVERLRGVPRLADLLREVPRREDPLRRRNRAVGLRRSRARPICPSLGSYKFESCVLHAIEQTQSLETTLLRWRVAPEI